MLLIYLIGAVDNLVALLVTSSVALVIGGVCVQIVLSVETHDYKFKKWPFIIALLCFIIASLLPSSNTSYKMLATYGVETILAENKVQEMGGKSLEVINKVLDEYLKEEN